MGLTIGAERTASIAAVSNLNEDIDSLWNRLGMAVSMSTAHRLHLYVLVENHCTHVAFSIYK